MLVVDSSLLVEHLRGNARATRFLETQAKQGPLAVPALVLWELWKGASTPARMAAVENLLDAVQPDPFAPAMARLAGVLHQDHQRRGVERPAIDLLIASHAIHHDCPLATLDRDYRSIKGLQVVHP
ncbi:MAG TPA: PIN domain-containing protein [Candidatus Thermoplasmatota archaeon]|nr:PIN domain-containing protein [Candidatus Thermoplasmatota archaeon]